MSMTPPSHLAKCRHRSQHYWGLIHSNSPQKTHSHREIRAKGPPLFDTLVDSTDIHTNFATRLHQHPMWHLRDGSGPVTNCYLL